MHTSVRDTPKSVSKLPSMSTDVCLSLYINSGIYGGVGKLICEKYILKSGYAQERCMLFVVSVCVFSGD